MFLCCCTPMLWNSMRQLLMKYDVNASKSAGARVVYNFEYYIVNFVLAFNNCINFYVYMMSGSSWRRAFIACGL